ncbi:CLUMA_CG002445, isoform A [Clunio marinus]|uniref:CLUMA_CG002445, isoform A n=1 Tax=Clunio marinus TaxID=568069 RepID=A0A1J1HKY5_9DIPT|nr:CLUMA_CG002445, isoform A [Clunio marinus]
MSGKLKDATIGHKMNNFVSSKNDQRNEVYDAIPHTSPINTRIKENCLKKNYSSAPHFHLLSNPLTLKVTKEWCLYQRMTNQETKREDMLKLIQLLPSKMNTVSQKRILK